jgi:hypothetical protein
MARGKSRSQRKSKAKSGRRRRSAQAKLEERRKRVLRWSVIISALVLAMGLGSYLLLSQRGPGSPGQAFELADRPIIKVTPKTYDFGTVSRAAGVVTAELMLENRGRSELVINGMRTSCGCTQASLIIDGEEGPLFGMHDNPVGWRARLAPGERAWLKVYYDPNVHGGLRGAVTREIEIYSNDPKSPVYTVRIKLVQTG